MVALSEVVVDLVAAQDENRFRALMQAHHYLGALPGIGETLRYVAHHRGQWLALVVFSAPALKCAARDRWIGWSFGVQFDRLHLLTNNSRFLLLPGAPRNLGSRVLSLCTRRLVSDWPARFAHRRPRLQGALGAKKIGMRPDPGEGEKRTNEIGTILPLLETVPDIARRTVTTDALLTQRALATYLLGRGAHYLFTVKGNQPNMLDDIRLTLDELIAQRPPDFTDESPKPEHGRRERRSIWVSSALNDYLDFPGVGQVFAIGRQTVEVKSAKRRSETAYGVTSLTPHDASPQRLLTLNRGHWTIEATHHILDWSFDEDRSRIRTGHGPENMTRLRRFAIGLIKARGLAVAETMRRLARNPRRVLDFLKMTANACPRAAPA